VSSKQTAAAAAAAEAGPDKQVEGRVTFAGDRQVVVVGVVVAAAIAVAEKQSVVALAGLAAERIQAAQQAGPAGSIIEETGCYWPS